jgi:hypothetical protein
MQFIVYDSDGEIRLNGTCADHDFLHQGPSGFVIEGVGDFRTHYVKDGVLTAYTLAQAAQKAVRNTDPALNWSNAAMAYI